ncbi:sensor histidine kinase [Paenibacillus gansuensis]|uniref:Sensor histidine kinase n=1 Tax=Paenibacillus gansuensis TaxID=306542 RepID=A0ABW5PBW2_9BACL
MMHSNASIFTSIRTKFILVFLAVLTPLVFFLYYNNYYARNLIKTQVTHGYETTLNNYVKQADEAMEATEKYLINVQQQELDVNAMDLNFTDNTEYTMTKVRVNNKFTMNLSYMKGIDSFMLYSVKNNEAVLSTNAYDYEQKLEAATKLMNDRSLVQPVPQRGLLETAFIQLGGKTYMIRLYNASSTLILGAWINLDGLLDTLNIKNSAILTKTGGVLANRGLSTEQTQWIQDFLRKQGDHSTNLERLVKLQEQEHLLFVKTSASQELRYVIMIPSSEILMNLSFFQKVILVVPAAILLIILFYVAFMQHHLIRPIQTIINGMRRLSQGNMDIQLNQRASAEFNYMTTTFNHMVSEIKSLKLFIYEEKLRVQQAELKQLQMQINPHFYANSLNIINGMAQLGDYSSVQNMTRLLAAYFRYVTQSSKELIPLREEIEHIQNYLHIQKYRYPSNLIFDVQIPEEWKGILLPPLTIQPFVENAIIHGFTKKMNPFIISLYGITTLGPDGACELVIEDNGVGVSAEKLEQLQQSAQLPQTDNSHLGIWNVQRRLKLYYGEEEVNISFANREEGGLRIVLQLPVSLKQLA